MDERDSDAERPLALSREQMRSFGYRVIDLLVDHFDEIGDQPVGAKLEPNAHFLEDEPPENGCDPNELLALLKRDVFPNNLHLDHPRFFAFVPSPGNFVSTMADALASGFNVFAGTWLGGSAAASMELLVIEWLRRFCGMPETAGGLLTSGGSAANLIALVAARQSIGRADLARATVYYSDQTHSSVERALLVIGFSSEQCRKIESDLQGRLPMESLRNAVSADRAAGLRPLCVIANAGTTSTGAVDPLEELAEFCQTEKLWLHADGAYGAAAIICPRGRKELRGLERVDSLSLDPHKWLFQPFECGCVLVRDRQLLRSAFRVTADYLRDVHRESAEVILADYGIQLTRGFRALKLWLSIKAFGMAAFREAVARGFELAELAERELRGKAGWEILSPAQMGIVCFRFGKDDELPGRIVEAMLREGYAFLTSTKIKQAICLRFCTINPRTTDQDMIESVRRLDECARKCSQAA
ncbi:MAG: pyridoxal-dependent decarboxylase [Spartobacteria bacterium]